MNEMNVTRRSGLDLRVMRVRADVKAIDLARAMNAQPSAVSRIETSRTVTDKAWARYTEALATLTTAATPKEAA